MKYESTGAKIPAAAEVMKVLSLHRESFSIIASEVLEDKDNILFACFFLLIMSR